MRYRMKKPYWGGEKLLEMIHIFIYIYMGEYTAKHLSTKIFGEVFSDYIFYYR